MLLDKLRSNLFGEGVLPKKKILDKVKSKIFCLSRAYVYTTISDVVFVKDIGEEHCTIKSNINIVEADCQNMETFYHQNPGLEKGSYKTTSYLDNNYNGAIAELDGKMIGYVWWTDAHNTDPQSRHPHLKRYAIELGEDESWGFDLFIIPEFRGGSLASDFFVLFRNLLREKGYTRVWGFARADNLPAMWIHRLQKYQPVKTVYSHLFLGTFLLSRVAGGRWFMRNVPFYGKQRFDYRFLF